MSIIDFYFVNPQGMVQGHQTDGSIVDLSEPDFASDIHSDGSYLWVLSTEPNEDTGGSVIKVQVIGENNWTTISGNAPGAERICTNGGGRCIYVAGNGELWQVNAAQDTIQYSVPAGLDLLQISSNMSTSQPYYWGLFDNPEVDGADLRHTTDLVNWVSPSGVSTSIKDISVGGPGFAPGGNPCWYVDGDNRVVVIEPAGGPSNISDPNFALSISASGNDVIYVISTEADQNLGGNFVKSWNGTWSTTNVPAIAVAGVYLS